MCGIFSCGNGQSLKSFKIRSDLAKFPFFYRLLNGYMLGEFVGKETDVLY